MLLFKVLTVLGGCEVGVCALRGAHATSSQATLGVLGFQHSVVCPG